MDTSKTVSRSALSFFSGTLLSRVSGMLRDMVMAFFFGTSPALAAFFLAYRFVYLLRRLLGEGLFHQGFIPHFEAKNKVDPREGALFFRDLFWSLAIFLGGLLLAAALFLYSLLHFGVISSGGEQIARLSLWMVPGIFFICLFGLTSGLLQSGRKFFLTSSAGVIFNLVWITGAILLHPLPIDQAVVGLAAILSVAFFCQWGATVLPTWQSLHPFLSKKELFRPQLFSRELKKLVGPLLFGIVGVASMQINSAVDVIFARCGSMEGPAYLWYAIRLQQLPLALFGIALASALLPSLSRKHASGDVAGFSSLLQFASKRTFLLILPCVVGIFLLGGASINMLFGRGDFSLLATEKTTLCLWGYGIGLLPAAFIQIFAPAFYARKDYRTPMIGFVASAVVNIALNAYMIFSLHLGAEAVAFSTSIAAWLNGIYLFTQLKKARSESPVSKEWGYFMKVSACCLFAGVLGLAGRGLVFEGGAHFPRDLISQISRFGIPALIYFAALFPLSKVIRQNKPI